MRFGVSMRLLAAAGVAAMLKACSPETNTVSINMGNDAVIWNTDIGVGGADSSVGKTDTEPDAHAVDSKTGKDTLGCTLCTSNMKSVFLLGNDNVMNMAPITEASETMLRIQNGGKEYLFAAAVDSETSRLVLASKTAVEYIGPDGKTYSGYATIVIAPEAEAMAEPTVLKIALDKGDFISMLKLAEVAKDKVDLNAGSAAYFYLLKGDKKPKNAMAGDGETIEGLGTEVFAGVITDSGAFLKLTDQKTGAAYWSRVQEGELKTDDETGLKIRVVAANNTIRPECAEDVFTLSWGDETHEVKKGSTIKLGDSTVTVLNAVADESGTGNASVLIRVTDAKGKVKEHFVAQSIPEKEIMVDGKVINVVGYKQVSVCKQDSTVSAVSDKESGWKYTAFVSDKARAFACALKRLERRIRRAV